MEKDLEAIIENINLPKALLPQMKPEQIVEQKPLQLQVHPQVLLQVLQMPLNKHR